MSEHPRRRKLAQLLKRAPWLVKAAYPFYQLTRPRFTMGVVGVLFDDAGRVLLAEHVYHPLVPWGVPGGAVSRGEHPADALVREYREELAIGVEVAEPLLIERTYLGHIDVAFRVHSGERPAVASQELLSAAWFTREELPSITKFQFRALTRAYAMFEREQRVGYDLHQP